MNTYYWLCPAGSTPNIRQPDPPTGRSVSISFLSSGGTQNDQESERQVPSGILNLLRALFPGGEIHVEDGSVQGMNSSSVSDQARTSNGVAVAPEAEPRVSEEGIFLSNLLHQVMPLISQAATREPGLVPAEAENSSEHTMAQDSSTVVCMLHHLSFPGLLCLMYCFGFLIQLTFFPSWPKKE